MRAFIAADIATEVVSTIESVVQRIEGRVHGARWVTPKNLHLTLRFLGETDEETLSALSETVTVAAGAHRPFVLDFRGIGFFPSARRPRVLWVGIDKPPEALRKLQHELETAARKHGFEPERRDFSAHLTLARFRKPQSNPRFTELVQELGEYLFGSSSVEELVLYRSILKPRGAEYQVLKRFPLGAGGGTT
jgi:2'-5' RNA ligase